MPRKIRGFILLSVIALCCVSCDLPTGPNYPGTLPGGKPGKTGTLTLYLGGNRGTEESRPFPVGTFRRLHRRPELPVYLYPPG
jgi:hypothetical protein